jgi:hypothetical protein
MNPAQPNQANMTIALTVPAIITAGMGLVQNVLIIGAGVSGPA